MRDERVLAYCNLFGVLGAIPTLIELDPTAKALVADQTISIGFSVKNGPIGTLGFRDGKAEMKEGTKGCSIKLYFPSCKKFNDMINGVGSPIPVSGFWHIGFLTGAFTALTDRLSAYLRPSVSDLQDPVFFQTSTVLMLHVIAGAVAQIGNEDEVGRFSASGIVDGTVHLSIGDVFSVGIAVKEHRLTALHHVSGTAFSKMQFDSLQTARDLFDGKINSVAAVGEGKVRVSGMISQLDNINRILDRVSLYLA